MSIGQISASLAAFNRTIDDYESMAKTEMIKAKQEKAFMYVLTKCCVFSHIDPRIRRVSKFRTDATELRLEFDRVKDHVSNMVCYLCTTWRRF